MTVKDYPIQWGFGITSPAPWSPLHPHKGVDRPTPMRTFLVINGQLVAYTGNTGGVSPHHHLQKVQSGQIVNPENGGFEIPRPAVVIQVDNVADTNIGKALRIRDAQGVEWSHFHLDEIIVNTGDQIGVELMNEGDVNNLYLSGWQRKATPQELSTWIGKPMEQFFYGGGKAQYEWLWAELRKAQNGQFKEVGIIDGQKVYRKV